jgi:uncharacterized iron-regulated membrane protein
MATTEIILLSVLAILGFVGYVLLNFGAKEPRHPKGDLFLAIYGFVIIITVVAGLLIQWPIEFRWEKLPAFYGIYGFSACVFLIYMAKGLRLWLPREEDYYEKRGGRLE